MSFNTLGLSAELLRAINEQNYHQATPVQQQAIPVILKGLDVMAAAQTGTGKTAGFTLPLLQRLSESTPEHSKHRPIRALILTPTRELAAQVSESVATYGKHLPLRSSVVFGGVNMNPQIAQLRRGVDILIATPGRLLDLISQKVANLSQVEILVLDEADRMLDMGFIHDIRRVLQLLPTKRQNLLFSATFSQEIKTLAKGILHNPVIIEVAKPNTTAKGITQLVHVVEQPRKRELLSFMIGSKNWRQVLVFTRTKHGANRLVQQLTDDGLSAAAIHGNKSQGARTKALADFKTGKVRVLVATDIAARGLDIDKLPHVVNYELPNVPEDYVHRIGRTGRAQQEGVAISLVSSNEFPYLKDIEKLLKHKIPQEVITGYESDATYKPEAYESNTRQKPKKEYPQRGFKTANDDRRASNDRKPSNKGRRLMGEGNASRDRNDRDNAGNRAAPQGERRGTAPDKRSASKTQWSTDKRTNTENRGQSKTRWSTDERQASSERQGGSKTRWSTDRSPESRSHSDNRNNANGRSASSNRHDTRSSSRSRPSGNRGNTR